MQYGKITAIAKYVPEKQVSNHQLAEIMDTNDEWINSRTGISNRHLAVTENTSDLCIQVARQLLAQSQTTPAELDFILVATMTPDFQTPSVACQVQGAIEADNAFAFDLNAACSGFVYAMAMAEKLIRSGSRKGLVIGGEVLSKILDWQDRGTAVLFGDGAGGVLLEADDTAHILAEKLAADGKRGLSLKSGGASGGNPYGLAAAANEPLQMNGRDIFDFAVRDVPKNIQAVLNLAELETSMVDYYLLHQANQRIVEKIARKLKEPLTKFPMSMATYGNTSAASIPLLLHDEVTAGNITLGSNQTLVLTGFGGGLTWGSLVLKV